MIPILAMIRLKDRKSLRARGAGIVAALGGLDVRGCLGCGAIVGCWAPCSHCQNTRSDVAAFGLRSYRFLEFDVAGSSVALAPHASVRATAREMKERMFASVVQKRKWEG
jgi:hypothetical protein